MRKGETKYTSDWLYAELKHAFNKLARNKDIMFKNELFEKKKYSVEKIYDLIRKYKEISEVQELSKRITNRLEARAVRLGLGFGEHVKNKTNAAFLIFFMKNAFGWQDKTEATHNITLPVPILMGMKKDTPAIEAGQDFPKQDFKKFVRNNKAEYAEEEKEQAEVAK